MTAQKHKLGVPPTHKSGRVQIGAMAKFAVPVEPILSPEEAVLQFVALSNQPFTIVEGKGFKNLFRSNGTSCTIESAETL
jgi:hypothetical protein